MEIKKKFKILKSKVGQFNSIIYKLSLDNESYKTYLICHVIWRNERCRNPRLLHLPVSSSFSFLLHAHPLPQSQSPTHSHVYPSLTQMPASPSPFCDMVTVPEKEGFGPGVLRWSAPMSRDLGPWGVGG